MLAEQSSRNTCASSPKLVKASDKFRVCYAAQEKWTRYKYVVQVIIGEQRGEAVRYSPKVKDDRHVRILILSTCLVQDGVSMLLGSQNRRLCSACVQ